MAVASEEGMAVALEEGMAVASEVDMEAAQLVLEDMVEAEVVAEPSALFPAVEDTEEMIA